MSNNKSPAADEIPLTQDISTNEEIPKEWNNGIIVKLPKKGEIKECKNWRGVTLLTTANKILAQYNNQPTNKAENRQYSERRTSKFQKRQIVYRSNRNDENDNRKDNRTKRKPDSGLRGL